MTSFWSITLEKYTSSVVPLGHTLPVSFHCDSRKLVLVSLHPSPWACIYRLRYIGLAVTPAVASTRIANGGHAVGREEEGQRMRRPKEGTIVAEEEGLYC